MNTVSVVIPCFNAGAFLEVCVASIVAQQGPFEIVEILVIDDQSSDLETLAALRTVSRVERVLILSNQARKGSAGARNTGIRHAKGEWIAFLDADDWWPKDSLSRRFEALQHYPDATWVGGDFGDVGKEILLPSSSRALTASPPVR